MAESIKNFQAKGGKSVILSYTVQDVAPGYTDETLMDEPPFDIYTSVITGDVDKNCHNLQEKKIEHHNWPIQKYLDSEPELGYLNMAEGQ